MVRTPPCLQKAHKLIRLLNYAHTPPPPDPPHPSLISVKTGVKTLAPFEVVKALIRTRSPLHRSPSTSYFLPPFKLCLSRRCPPSTPLIFVPRTPSWSFVLAAVHDRTPGSRFSYGVWTRALFRCEIRPRDNTHTQDRTLSIGSFKT